MHDSGAPHHYPKLEEVLQRLSGAGFREPTAKETPEFYQDEILTEFGWDPKRFEEVPNIKLYKFTDMLYSAKTL